MPAITITDLTNAKTDVDHLAAIANSISLTATDRLGNTKKTLAGLSAEFPNASANASTATTQAGIAITKADIATTQAGLATAAKIAAESARDSALIQSGVYTTEALGRAAVADGQAFKVQGVGGIAAFEYRRTNSSTSVLIATYPSYDGVISATSSVQPIGLESGWAYAVVDSSGRTVGGWRIDGTFEPLKITLPALSVSQPMLTSDIKAGLVDQGINSMTTNLAVETGYSYAIVDSAGRLIFGIPISGSAINTTVTRALTADNARNAAKSSSNYLVYAELDSYLKSQIKSIRISDGKRTILTTLGDNVGYTITSDDKILFSSNSSGAWKDYYVPAAGGIINPVIPLTDIDCWGDSLSVSTYQSALSALLAGRSIRAQGIGSQVSAQIVARQGGSPALLTVTGNQIPTSEAVTVSTITIELLTSLANPTATLSMTGTLAGIPGTLTKSGTATYTFTRTTSGTVVTCPPSTPFIPDIAVTGRTATPILWAGTNDVIYGGTSANLTANINAATAYLTPYIKRAIVIGPLNRSDQPSGSSAYTLISQMETALAANASTNHYVFFNARRYLIDNGLADAGITPTSQDLTDISQDIPPSSLRVDTTHLTPIGYSLIATKLASIINNYGF